MYCFCVSEKKFRIVMLWNQHLKNFFFMCVTNSKQKFHMWNKNENILGHFVYFMCENNRIILYIYLKKKNVNCLSLGFTTNYFLGANKFSCEANFFSMHEKSWHSHCFTLEKTFASPYKKTLTSPSGLQ